MTFDEGNILTCSACEEEVIVCDTCGKLFEPGDSIDGRIFRETDLKMKQDVMFSRGDAD